MLKFQKHKKITEKYNVHFTEIHMMNQHVLISRQYKYVLHHVNVNNGCTSKPELFSPVSYLGT